MPKKNADTQQFPQGLVPIAETSDDSIEREREELAALNTAMQPVWASQPRSAEAGLAGAGNPNTAAGTGTRTTGGTGGTGGTTAGT